MESSTTKEEAFSSSPQQDAGSEQEEQEQQQQLLELSNGALPESRLAEIWESHLEQYRRLDDLEKRIDEHAKCLRRRVLNVLEAAPSHRLSHMRLFVSHMEREITKTAEDSAAAGAEADATTSMQPPGGTTVSGAPQTPNEKKWSLVMEGKLLIGHLDHASAKAFDERLKREFQQRHKVSADHPSMPQAVSAHTTTQKTTPTEDEPSVEPIKFTHFFDKLVVQFQSLYQPAVQAPTGDIAAALSPKASTPKAATTSSSAKKKSRSAKRQKTSAQEVEAPETVDPRTLTFSDPTEFVWNKTVTTVVNPAADTGDNKTSPKPGSVSTTQTTSDAHAFCVHYNSPPPPSASMKLYGAIATAQLYPTRGPEQRYKPSKEFAKVFFPTHIDAVSPPVLPTVAIAEAKKAEEEQETSLGETNTPSKHKRKASSTTVAPANQTAPNALDNEIHVPTSLTMKEIILSLYTYIEDRKLTKDDDPSLIHNDKTLQTLFECDTMRFSDIQNLLMQKKLILLLPKPAPITLKYVMIDGGKEEGGSEDEPEEEEQIAAPMTMDLHNDVYIPNLFPVRVRECLRRIKRRELEYTSSRTKARYLVMASRAKEESAVKTKLEEAICGNTMGEWPVLTCLAKAAPPHSEARTTATLDAKISYLLQQVEQSQEKAQQAWNLVGLCRSMAATEDTKDSTDRQEKQQIGEDNPNNAMEIDSLGPAAHSTQTGEAVEMDI